MCFLCFLLYISFILFICRLDHMNHWLYLFMNLNCNQFAKIVLSCPFFYFLYLLFLTPCKSLLCPYGYNYGLLHYCSCLSWDLCFESTYISLFILTIVMMSWYNCWRVEYVQHHVLFYTLLIRQIIQHLQGTFVAFGNFRLSDVLCYVLMRWILSFHFYCFLF